ncbi:hypothetical protein QCA50_009253 [Cerrena zonata]|uniref:Uncharacterized protein n=1 Tax=Cerrena zonata TaxID=2478898 RepID=A0AAW0G218_9APHY
MAAAYTILGKQVPAHVLSILTLSSVVAVAAWPREKKAAPAPVAPAATKKEDDFDLEKWFNDLTKEESK